MDAYMYAVQQCIVLLNCTVVSYSRKIGIRLVLAALYHKHGCPALMSQNVKVSKKQ
jgi:hypothetical protein